MIVMPASQGYCLPIFHVTKLFVFLPLFTPLPAPPFNSSITPRLPAMAPLRRNRTIPRRNPTATHTSRVMSLWSSLLLMLQLLRRNALTITRTARTPCVIHPSPCPRKMRLRRRRTRCKHGTRRTQRGTPRRLRMHRPRCCCLGSKIIPRNDIIVVIVHLDVFLPRTGMLHVRRTREALIGWKFSFIPRVCCHRGVTVRRGEFRRRRRHAMLVLVVCAVWMWRWW